MTTSDEAEAAVEQMGQLSNKDRSDDVVLLIHGTFAADKDHEDVGVRWWQRGSTPWRWLMSNLPRGTALPNDGQLFHWSGANSQAERLAASTSLLARMIELEMEGRNYHLVGHSHGGSVIWEALVSAQAMQSGSFFPGAIRAELDARGKIPPLPSGRGNTQRSRAAARARAWRDQTRKGIECAQLDGLRSWTTVGTPFLHLLPKRGRLLDGWPSQSFSLAREKGVLGGLRYLALFLAGGTAFFVAFLYMLSASGLLEAAPHGPGRLPGTSAWPLIVTFGLLLGMAGMGVLSRADFGNALIKRHQQARLAFDRFGDRWLGLHAPADEAIALLQGLAEAPGTEYAYLQAPAEGQKGRKPAAPRSFPPVPVRMALPPQYVDLGMQTKTRPMNVVAAPVYALFNRLAAKRVGAMITKTLVAVGQGNDLPRTALVHASRWPLPQDQVPPGLPPRAVQQLEERVQAAAGELVPAARALLAQAAVGGPLPAQMLTAEQRALSTAALVHTSYFDCEEVLRLIQLHIGRTASCPVRGDRGDEDGAHWDRQLHAWLDTHSAAVQSVRTNSP